jgi:hypothetical protein
MIETVTIRRKPSPADLNRLAAVARQTVLDIAKMDGALGGDAIAMLYVQRLYEAVVDGAIRQRKGAK